MTELRIPFNRPTSTGRELERLGECVRSGRLSGDGPFGKDCQELLEHATGAARVLLTPSCTAALELAAFLVDIGPGDEVIVPAFTFVSTINAFVIRGARPIFVDVELRTLNLDPGLVAAAITPRTRAILPVHYGGIACAMEKLVAIAAEHGIAIVEDNAHGLFATYRKQPLGSFGRLSTLSFHETKNFTCGEGGALVINDPQLCGRAEILREKGTNRSRFLRGDIDRYSWVDVGSSYLPSELQAAFLFAQLEERDAIQRARKHIWQRYYAELTPWASTNRVRLPHVPAECEPAYHLFHLVLPSSLACSALTRHLRRRSIAAVSHYPPLHLSEMGRKLGGQPGQCPVTEAASECLLRLPFYTSMSQGEQSEVIGAVLELNPVDAGA